MNTTWTTKYDVAILTAQRRQLINIHDVDNTYMKVGTSPNFKTIQKGYTYTSDDNATRNETLKVLLMKQKYDFVPLTSTLKGKENALLVVNTHNERDFFNQLFIFAEWFNQDNFLYKSYYSENFYLVGTNTYSLPGYAQQRLYGDLKRINKEFTCVENWLTTRPTGTLSGAIGYVHACKQLIDQQPPYNEFLNIRPVIEYKAQWEADQQRIKENISRRVERLCKSSVNQLTQWVNEYDVAVLTAWSNKLEGYDDAKNVYMKNGGVEDLSRGHIFTREDNCRRNMLLKALLTELKYGFVSVHLEAEEEEQLLVVNVHKKPEFYKRLFILAQWFNQDNFLYKPRGEGERVYVVGTKATRGLGLGERKEYGGTQCLEDLIRGTIKDAPLMYVGTITGHLVPEPDSAWQQYIKRCRRENIITFEEDYDADCSLRWKTMIERNGISSFDQGVPLCIFPEEGRIYLRPDYYRDIPCE